MSGGSIATALVGFGCCTRSGVSATGAAASGGRWPAVRGNGQSVRWGANHFFLLSKILTGVQRGRRAPVISS